MMIIIIPNGSCFALLEYLIASTLPFEKLLFYYYYRIKLIILEFLSNPGDLFSTNRSKRLRFKIIICNTCIREFNFFNNSLEITLCFHGRTQMPQCNYSAHWCGQVYITYFWHVIAPGLSARLATAALTPPAGRHGASYGPQVYLCTDCSESLPKR